MYFVHIIVAVNFVFRVKYVFLTMYIVKNYCIYILTRILTRIYKLLINCKNNKSVNYTPIWIC